MFTDKNWSSSHPKFVANESKRFGDTFEFGDNSGDSAEATNRFQDMTRYALEPPGPELYNAPGFNFSK